MERGGAGGGPVEPIVAECPGDAIDQTKSAPLRDQQARGKNSGGSEPDRDRDHNRRIGPQLDQPYQR